MSKKSDREKDKQILKEGQVPQSLQTITPHLDIEKKGLDFPPLQPMPTKPSEDDTKPAEQKPQQNDGNSTNDGKNHSQSKTPPKK